MLAENDPFLLANHGVQLQKARESLVASGYEFKKGRSWSKMSTSNIEDTRSSHPKCAKVDTETRIKKWKRVFEIYRCYNRRREF